MSHTAENGLRATGAIVPDHIRCICPEGLCQGVPGDSEGPRVCRACMALDPEEGCIRERPIPPGEGDSRADTTT